MNAFRFRSTPASLRPRTASARSAGRSFAPVTPNVILRPRPPHPTSRTHGFSVITAKKNAATLDRARHDHPSVTSLVGIQSA